MREIKFRGKRKDNGEWVYGDLITGPDVTYIVVTKPNPDEDGYWKWHEVIPETVGQFTGLKDWYVGDIIQKGEIIRAITVDYEHGMRFMLGKHTLCKLDAEHGTRIGNIHENPGLLEGESQCTTTTKQ